MDRSSKGNTFLLWYSVLPTSWVSIQLRNLLTNMLSGNWGEDPGMLELDLPCARIADFDWNRLEIRNSVIKTVRSYTKEQSVKFSLQDGDLLIEKSGGGEKQPVGRCVQYRGKEGPIFANFAIRLRPNTLVSSNFLRFTLAAAYFRGHSWKILNQTTGLQNLDISALRSSPIPVPPLQEQETIVAYLDSKTTEIDGLLEKMHREVELLERYRRKLIARTVTRGLDPDAPMKDSGIKWIGKIPENWHITRIKNLTNIRAEKSDSSDPYLGLENLQSYRGLEAKWDEHKAQELTGEGNLAIPGDIVFSKLRVYLAKGMIVDRRLRCTSELIIIEPIHVNSRYLNYLLKVKPFISYLDTSSYGARMPRISPNTFISHKIPVPPLDVQVLIADYLDSKMKEIDSTITGIKQQIELLGKYRKQIINDAVTGKIRVGEIA